MPTRKNGKATRLPLKGSKECRLFYLSESKPGSDLQYLQPSLDPDKIPQARHYWILRFYLPDSG